MTRTAFALLLAGAALAGGCRSTPRRAEPAAVPEPAPAAPAPAAAPAAAVVQEAPDTAPVTRAARDTLAAVPRRATTTPDTGAAALAALARDALAVERELAPPPARRRALGVLPWRTSDQDTLLGPLSYGLADLLMTDLSRSARLRVVDRLRLEALRTELQLTASGGADSATGPRAGNLLRAHELLLGGIARLRNRRLRVDAAVADVATGELRPALSASAPIADILAAEKALAHRLFRQLGVTLTPAERAAVDQRPTRNLAALLAYGRAVRFDVEGRYVEAASQYETALRLDPRFTLARTRQQEAQARGARAALAQAQAEARAEEERRKADAEQQETEKREAEERSREDAERRRRARAASINRIADTAADRINRSLIAPGATWRQANAADPSFPALQAVIVIVIEVP